MKKNVKTPAIDVTVACPSWLQLDFDPVRLAKDIAPLVCDVSALQPFTGNADLELSILLADNLTVRTLNREYRGKDKPTNVLSFPGTMEDQPDAPVVSLGDIVLARETIIDEAVKEGKTVRDHFTHLLIHGILHLHGYDHEEDGDAEIMQSLEISILRSMGIENPYGSA